MTELTKELIAIGSSVTAHCQPCIAIHVDKARELGASEEEIKEAMAVGFLVEKGASASITKFISETYNKSK